MRYCRFILTLCLLLASSSYLYAVNSSESEEIFRFSVDIAEHPEVKWSFYSFLLGLVLFFVTDWDSKVGFVIKSIGAFLLFFGGYGVIFFAFCLFFVIGSIAQWLFQCVLALLVYFLAFSIAIFVANTPTSCPMPSCPSITAETGVSNTTSGLASIFTDPRRMLFRYRIKRCIPWDVIPYKSASRSTSVICPASSEEKPKCIKTSRQNRSSCS